MKPPTSRANLMTMMRNNFFHQPIRHFWRVSIFTAIFLACLAHYGAAATTAAPSREDIAAAINYSTHYLLQATMPGGQFVYSINLDSRFGMIDTYNIVRHSGAMYALGMIDQAHPQPDVLAALQRSSNWIFASQIKPVAGHPDFLGIWETPTSEHPQMISTGNLGLGLVGLTALESVKPEAIPIDKLRRIGEMLLWMQKPDGTFQTAYYPDKSTFETTLEVLYYPGEAALGLTCLYEQDRDPRWLMAALKALSALATSRQSGDDIPPDHWAMLATQKVLLHLQDIKNPPVSREQLLAHARLVCASLMANQQPAAAGEVAGSFSPDGLTTPTATRMEGLLAALAFLPPEDAALRQQIQTSVAAGISFLLRAQVKSGQYSGAFPHSIIRKETKDNPRNMLFNIYAGQVRIDFVQHAVCALLRYQATLSSPSSSAQ